MFLKITFKSHKSNTDNIRMTHIIVSFSGKSCLGILAWHQVGTRLKKSKVSVPDPVPNTWLCYKYNFANYRMYQSV